MTSSWVRGTLTDAPALIIAGGYRCGTTSLFTALARHPEIMPSRVKEPAFFFSIRQQEVPSAYPRGYESDAYLSLFRHRPRGRVMLEATSNYLNDPGCARRIRDALPNARIVIALREPVARLASWYRFLQFQGKLDLGTSFTSWIYAQLADERPCEERPYELRAIAHCRYSMYVREYLEVFGRERVHLIWFEKVRGDPAAVITDLCTFAELDPTNRGASNGRERNPGMRIRRPTAFRWYRTVLQAAFTPLRPFPGLRFKLAARLFGDLEPRLLPFFTAPAEPVTVAPAVRTALVRHLRDDIEPLTLVTGRTPPWAREYGA